MSNPSGLVNRFLDFFYPPRCLVCAKPGAVVHSGCRAELAYLGEPLCQLCGHPLPPIGATCSSLLCITPPSYRYLDKARAIFRHDGGARQAVLRLKYRGVTSLRQWLATEMAQTARTHKLDEVAAIVPVPLHARRERERGYNQAQVIAQDLGELLSLPVATNWLLRARFTRSQVGLGASERVQNVADAFEWQTSPLNNHTILLIDDVFTTGATLNSCAAAIKKAGAGQVFALTVTREISAE